MTIDEIINKVDALCPNQYSSETKMSWLSQLDGKVYDELISSHVNPAITEFAEYTSAEDELLIPYPYGSDIYVYYLQAKIAAQNAETAKYNQFIVLYNTAYQDYCNLYNRKHMAKSPWHGNRFKF